MNIITKDYIDDKVILYARQDIRLNGQDFKQGQKIKSEYDSLKYDKDCVYNLLKSGSLSLVSPKVLRVELLKDLPGVEAGHTLYINWEIAKKSHWDKKEDRVSSQDVSIGDFKTWSTNFENHPTWFKTEVVDNPKLNSIIFPCD